MYRLIWCTISIEVGLCFLFPIGPPGTNLRRDFNQNTNTFISENTFKKVVLKISAILFMPQCINIYSPNFAIEITVSANLFHPQNAPRVPRRKKNILTTREPNWPGKVRSRGPLVTSDLTWWPWPWPVMRTKSRSQSWISQVFVDTVSKQATRGVHSLLFYLFIALQISL